MLIETARNAFQCKLDVAIFNTPRNSIDECIFIKHGLRGVFYVDDSSKLIAKGIESIFSGEFWYSRSTLSSVISKSLQCDRPISGRNISLTAREIEIFNEIINGASNNEIAAKLFVSDLTVKTHVQNIYKKIKVKKRAHAIKWAINNLFLLQLKD